ncbi:head-tail connector protein [Roseibium algae]|uniref:Phage head-tail connector protein n=1 Tax=Roseibium algae TaxID=3123038 RepID=A0ABU8TJ56_9HYPH
MTSVLVTPPVSEPVSVDDMRAQLRLSGSQEENLLTEFIEAARAQIETETRRAMIRQGWRFYLEAWPMGRVVTLPIAPVLSVNEITVYDQDGTGTTLDPDDFTLDRGACPGRVRVKLGAGIPTAQLQGLEIDFTAGYGDSAADVPAPMRQSIRLLAAHWFENREAGTDLAMASLPHGLDRLISVNRVLLL